MMMDPIEPFGGITLAQALIHLGYLVVALAYLVRDILWLRLLAIIANLIFAAVGFLAMAEPHWDVIAWTLSLAAINLAHSLWLVYERGSLRFTPDELSLKETAFQTIDPVFVRKLLRRGKWQDFTPETQLVNQGDELDRLILIAKGETAVQVAGHKVSQLGCGKFIGEIGFLTGQPATADVIASAPLRCLVWKRRDLERLKTRKPELFNALYAAIGKDLALKTAAQNLTLAEGTPG